MIKVCVNKNDRSLNSSFINIIQIHNNVLWKWNYSTNYSLLFSTFSLKLGNIRKIFNGMLLVPRNIVMELNNVIFLLWSQCAIIFMYSSRFSVVRKHVLEHTPNVSNANNYMHIDYMCPKLGNMLGYLAWLTKDSW